ncbi:MAG: tetratricopeptide repeat protein [Bacteroidetes bacterium]|jgi:tetratricopeptide (TPR) repeat protein|nr:tetratricopeptide repeat protein [Bacteroidota bacterium]
MTTVQRSLAVALVISIGLATVEAQPNPAAAADKVAALIAEGNALATQKFDNAGALARFEQAYALAPDNVELLILLSRTHIDIGEHLPSGTDAEKSAQLKHYEKSLEYANKAIAGEPNGSAGYTRRAIANGRVALFRGIWESLDLVKQVKADIEKAIALDPKNATAYYILARTHAKVAERPRVVRWPLGLSWASYEEAAKHYEQAIALRPGFIMYRLDAARTYVELEEFAKARDHLKVIPGLAKEDEDDDQFRKEAADLMKKIENE